MGLVQSHLQGNIKLNPLSKNTEVYCCTPIYRFITSRKADDSTSTLQAHKYNIGEKPTVILNTYINRHAEPPNITKQTTL